MYYPTSIPDLIVDISCNEKSDGTIRISGIGINPVTDQHYYELGRKISKRGPIAHKDKIIKEVISIMEDRFKMVFGYALASRDSMLASFAAVKKSVLGDHIRLSPNWRKESTNVAALTFFERNTLPFLLDFADSRKRIFLGSDRSELEDKLISVCLRRSDGNRERAVETARKHLKDADIIYAHMRDNDWQLPDFKLSSDEPFQRVPRPEQQKHLPRPLLTAFYAILPSLIDSDPYKVFFTIFVIFGLRPAESAARKPSDIMWYNDFCTAEVLSQARNRNLDQTLKNEYSRRIIIISYWGRCLLERCCNAIGDNYPHDDTAMNDAEECSEWVKNLLIDIGISASYLEDSNNATPYDDYEQDDCYGDNKIKKDRIVCYILRRIFASIVRNEMGMSLYETDRLLGHAPKGATEKKENKLTNLDFSSSDTQKSIAAKMERYIFDPKYSLNPSCVPYLIAQKQELHMIEFSEYLIKNNSSKNLNLSINLESAEAGEITEFKLPLGCENNLKAISTPKSWEGRDRTVIGDTSKKTSKKDGISS